jgi:hypothetical protein
MERESEAPTFARYGSLDLMSAATVSALLPGIEPYFYSLPLHHRTPWENRTPDIWLRTRGLTTNRTEHGGLGGS